ncbi:MAG: MFS transporter [Nocardioidaceae bacterium]
MKQPLHEVHRLRIPRRLGSSVWAHRDVRLLVPARALSLAGDGMALITLVLRLHDAGHGPAAVTGLFLCFTIPTVLTIGVAGQVVDTRDSRLVLGAATAVQVLACVGLVFGGNLVATYGCVLLLQLGVAFSSPAWAALLPRIVGDEQLGRVVAWQQGLGAATQPAGAALGGLLYGIFGSQVAFWCDAGTFALLLVVALSVRTRRSPDEKAAGASRGDEPAAPNAAQVRRHGHRSLLGIRVLRADALLWPLFCALLPFILFVEGVNVVEVFLARDALGASAAEYGLAEVAFGIGAVAGSVAAGRIEGDRRRARVTLLGLGLTCLAVLGAGLAPTFSVYLVLAILIGGMNTLANAVSGALFMTRSPEHQRGRVSAALNGCARLASTIALIAGGLVGTWLGPRPTFLLGGALGAAVTTAAALWLRIRIRHLTTDSADPRSTAGAHAPTAQFVSAIRQPRQNADGAAGTASEEA